MSQTQVLPLSVDLAAYRGDTWSQEFRLLHGSTPENLTGATVSSEARSRAGQRRQLTVTILDATDGKIQLSIPSTLPHGIYSYDVEVRDAASKKTTWLRGTLVLAQDITNELP